MNTNKKKILFMVGGSYVFGAEIVTLDVLRGLKNDYDIHCAISGWNDGDFRARLEKDNINYTEIKLGWYYITKLFWSLDSLIHYPPAFFKYYKILNKFNPDLIYVISYRNLFLLYPLIKKNVIYHVHDPNSFSRQHRFFLKIIDHKVNNYIAVSNYIKNDLINCGLAADKITVVHNGVEMPDEGKIIKTKSDILKIGIVGQVNYRKGHHIALEALKILKERGHKFYFYIYGTGDSHYIKQLELSAKEYALEDRIFWMGYASDKITIYENLDLVICPSILPESFGLTAIEPANFKIPVIASNIGGYKEIVRDGVNGFLFENENAANLADRIKCFLDDHDKIVTIGALAYDYVNEFFSTESTMNKITAMIEKLDNN